MMDGKPGIGVKAFRQSERDEVSNAVLEAFDQQTMGHREQP